MIKPNHFPTADFDNLFRQSYESASTYMLEAIDSIDNILGKDYAKNNPALVAAFMQTAAIDFHAACLGKAAGGLANQMEQMNSMGVDLAGSVDVRLPENTVLSHDG